MPAIGYLLQESNTLAGVQRSQNPKLVALAGRAGPRVTGAIYQAAAVTGADFGYLMAKAGAESSFDPAVQAETSSATGLFQFVDATWLQMIRRYGARHGMEEYTRHIDQKGHVADPEMRKEILALRKEPETAALMAAEFAGENKRTLVRQTHLNEKEVGPTELYLAHFLGAGGATRFLKALADNGEAPAAPLLPAAAAVNRNVFYAPDNKPRSLKEIYKSFDRKFSFPASQESAWAKAGQPSEHPAQDINEATRSEPSGGQPPRAETAVAGSAGPEISVTQANRSEIPKIASAQMEEPDRMAQTKEVSAWSDRFFKSAGQIDIYQKALLPHKDLFDPAVTRFLLTPAVSLLFRSEGRSDNLFQPEERKDGGRYTHKELGSSGDRVRKRMQSSVNTPALLQAQADIARLRSRPALQTAYLSLLA